MHAYCIHTHACMYINDCSGCDICYNISSHKWLLLSFPFSSIRFLVAPCPLSFPKGSTGSSLVRLVGQTWTFLHVFQESWAARLCSSISCECSEAGFTQVLSSCCVSDQFTSMVSSDSLPTHWGNWAWWEEKWFAPESQGKSARDSELGPRILRFESGAFPSFAVAQGPKLWLNVQH
jgi:hypothetical protein